jgi:catechol 2,3-dioxygenase-like lactoylglutathione lyase family enzyme
MAEVKRIHHVAISVPPEHEGAAVEFYRDVLQFKVLGAPEALAHVPVIAWFQIGDCELHLLREPNGAEGMRRHLCLEVDDLEPFRQRVEQTGQETDDADPIPGRPRFFCYDPSGNRIEFLVDNERNASEGK